MQCIYRKMCSLGEVLEENHMEEEEIRLCREQGIRTLEEDYRTTEENRGQEETPMQQMLIEEEKETEHAMYVESGAIQPKTIGKERGEQQRCHKSWQKTIDDSKLLAGLLKYVQCIAPRKAGK